MTSPGSLPWIHSRARLVAVPAALTLASLLAGLLGAGPTLAHGPDPLIPGAGTLWSRDQVVPFQWASGGVPPGWMATAMDLGALSGDHSTPRLHTKGQICAGDTDWFRFTLREEQAEKVKDLSTSATLTTRTPLLPTRHSVQPARTPAIPRPKPKRSSTTCKRPGYGRSFVRWSARRC